MKRKKEIARSPEDVAFRAKLLEQFRNGTPLFGKEGVLAPMLKEVIETVLEVELDAYVAENDHLEGNKRNGYKPKTVRSGHGEVTLDVPQARQQKDFEPQIVKKRQTILADSLADKIIGLYGIGTSLRDIRAQIMEFYDMDVSEHVLSEIIDRILPKVRAWQSRPLQAVYPVVWLDAMFIKVRNAEGKVTTQALNVVLALDAEGRKEVLGCYLMATESARGWLEILTDLQNRGLKEILIVCTDNLTGFESAIQSVYPQALVQTCIVHQIRNSLKYVATKDRAAFVKELKNIYTAPSLTAAEGALDDLERRYGEQYPLVIDSWRRNWPRLSTFFAFTEPIRRLIYTTNPIEGVHRQLRRVLKTKGAFTSPEALMKLVFLAVQNIENKWRGPQMNWGLTAQQLHIHFGQRMPIDL